MFPSSKVRRVKAGSYMVPLPCKVQFRKQPTCHMLVDAPSSASHRSVKRCPLPHVLAGFASGDIILYNPWWKLEQARNKSAPKGVILSVERTLNRAGCIESAACTSLQWMPGHEGTRIIASFLNGAILVLSLYWEDPRGGKVGRGEAQPPSTHTMLQSLVGLEAACFSAWWAPKGSRVNPMCKLQLSSSPVWQLCFAPDKRTLALACQDGYLRILDLDIARDEAVAAPVLGSLKGEAQQNGLLIAACEVAYRSYYGGFTAVAWSKDMRYLVSGGEDDLVSVWSYPRKELLARGHGHQSWVSSVAVNTPESNKDCLRFASVGLDCRLLLWEFSPEICKRPRASSSIHRRPAAPPSPQVSTDSPERSLAAYPALESSLPLGRRTVPAKQRRQTAALHPIGSHRAHALPLHGVRHVEGHYITVGIDGEVSVWVPGPRPPSIDLVALLREHSPARTIELPEEAEELPAEVLEDIARAERATALDEAVVAPPGDSEAAEDRTEERERSVDEAGDLEQQPRGTESVDDDGEGTDVAHSDGGAHCEENGALEDGERLQNGFLAQERNATDCHKANPTKSLGSPEVDNEFSEDVEHDLGQGVATENGMGGRECREVIVKKVGAAGDACVQSEGEGCTVGVEENGCER